MGEDTSSLSYTVLATPRCVIVRNGSSSAYVPLRTVPSSVTVRSDRALLSGLMQIVTSAVRLFVSVTALDVLGFYLPELLDGKRWPERSIGMPKCWDGPTGREWVSGLKCCSLSKPSCSCRVLGLKTLIATLSSCCLDGI